MPDDIPTIDAWNARLNPPAPVDSDESDSTWPELGDCGCCRMPKCCPPQLECQQMSIRMVPMGFSKFGSEDDGLIYRKQGWRTNNADSGTEVSGNYPTDAGTGQVVWSVDSTKFEGYEYSRNYYGGASGAPDSGSDSSPCPLWPIEPPAEICENSGTATYEFWEVKAWGGPPANLDNAITHTITDQHLSAEGETTVEFAAWRALYPTDADYDDAVAAHQTYLSDYDTWNAAEPQEPDYPTYEDWLAAWEAWDASQPAFVEEPTARPAKETYGPCDFKSVLTIVIETHYFGKNSDGTSAAPATDQAVLDAWWQQPGGPTTNAPCPGTSVRTQYIGNVLLSVSYQTSTPGPEAVWENGVGREAWLSAAISVIDAVEFAPECAALSSCYASREIVNETIPPASESNPDPGAWTTLEIRERIFRYRWKLNKCCGLYAGLSWLEVFYPQDFLDWLNGSDPTPPAPVNPTPTPKAWEWIGGPSDVHSDCDHSRSGSESWDEFDDQNRWSPWSNPVRVSGYGQTFLRSLYMTCYRSDYGTKPDFIPLYGNYDPSDLDGDGTPDSQQ